MREHVLALQEAGLDVPVTAGITGPAADRAVLAERLPGEHIEADEGFEWVTLSALRTWAQSAPAGAVALYAHTKGARDPGSWNTAWRRSMTAHVVGRWRECVQLLADGFDTVGCHWLTPEQYHVRTPFYGGNFWWTTAAYAARLPPVDTSDRFGSEAWIGLGNPRAYDLRPGWPSESLFSDGDGDAGEVNRTVWDS